LNLGTAEFPPQVGDMNIHSSFAGRALLSAHQLKQLTTTKHFAWLRLQEFQQSKFYAS
jgi:hypothetical protein